ncbi:MAG: tetratricopeptide repeat protein [Nitrospinae bacterium]|nr:tetratricopeptide repeat protein [Nitrospinota bacterium]
MTFDEILAHVRELLQREGRVSYRALKRRFGLDDEYLEDLKAEIIDAQRLASDEDGKVLVWTGSVRTPPTPATGQRALALATAGEEVVLHALANVYLGIAYQAQGDYRRAIDCFSQTVASLEGARRRERFGQVFLPAVLSCCTLAWCHAELGTFAEGSALGDEGLQIAEAVAHPGSLMYASLGVGLLALRQGDLSRALPRLERALSLCQDADLPLFFPWTAAHLGAAYTRAGRVADAMPLLTQAMEQTTRMGMVFFQGGAARASGEQSGRRLLPRDAQSLAAAPGCRDDQPSGARQGPPSRGGRAGGGQDRRGAAVCGGVDQDGAGVRMVPAVGGPRCRGDRPVAPTRTPAPTGDSHHAARLADGAAGSPGDREGPGATWGDAGARVCLRPAAGCLSMGRGYLATGAAAVGGGGVPVPAGAAAAGDVSLQARPDPGCSLSVVAQEHTAAVPSAHCPGGGGTLSRAL